MLLIGDIVSSSYKTLFYLKNIIFYYRGLDITKVFIALGLSDWVTKSQIVTGAGTFAVAYAIHKVFMPVRITITLASVPLIVRYLRKVGFLKK